MNMKYKLIFLLLTILLFGCIQTDMNIEEIPNEEHNKLNEKIEQNIENINDENKNIENINAENLQTDELCFESIDFLKFSKDVYVSPSLDKINASRNISNAMNLIQIVLIGNDINPIMLIRATEQGKMIKCYSNLGDAENSIELSKTDCEKILNDEENIIILIDEGEKSCFVENKKISIKATESEISNYVYKIISNIFPNSQQILDSVNKRILSIS